MELLKFLKAIYYSLSGYFTAMLVYFLPIKDLTIAIAIAFIVNFAFGIIAGILTQHESINFKKALYAFCEVAVYLVILTCMFTLGEKLKGDEWVYRGIYVLTCAWICFYLANWSKNLKRLFPTSRGINFFYFVLNLEFLKRIPYLKKFEEYEKTTS